MAAYSSLQTGNWTDSATWNPNGIPGAGDTVAINSGHTVTVPSGSGYNYRSGYWRYYYYKCKWDISC